MYKIVSWSLFLFALCVGLPSVIATFTALLHLVFIIAKKSHVSLFHIFHIKTCVLGA